MAVGVGAFFSISQSVGMLEQAGDVPGGHLATETTGEPRKEEAERK